MLHTYEAIFLGIEDVMKWIHIFFLDPYRVMKMSASRAAAITHKGDHLSSLHFLTLFHVVSCEVAIGGGYTLTVIDTDIFTQVSVPTPPVNYTICRGNDGCALAATYIQAIMKLFGSSKRAASPAKTGS